MLGKVSDKDFSLNQEIEEPCGNGCSFLSMRINRLCKKEIRFRGIHIPSERYQSIPGVFPGCLYLTDHRGIVSTCLKGGNCSSLTQAVYIVAVPHPVQYADDLR